MLPRTYSPERVRRYLKRIRLAQQTGLSHLDEVLDPAIARLTRQHANAIGCPRETILCSLLVAAGSCMGPRTDVKIDDDWLEKPILWILVAGRRGDFKTPALNRVKSAIVALEHQIQVLHGALSSDDATKTRPYLVDQRNLKKVEEELKTFSARQNVIGMFDNFGTFLRNYPQNSMFSDPNLLLSLYETSIPQTSDDVTAEEIPDFHCNFLAMIEAMDAAALLETFDADGLSDRVHVVCPRVPGCKLTQGTVSGELQPELAHLLATIVRSHQCQKVRYTFTEEALAEFHRCLAEFELWQSGLAHDERKRGVLGKAPGQLARLCAVLCALKNGLDLCPLGLDVNLLLASTISPDIVISSRQILTYFINQKLCFLPEDEGLSEDVWDELADDFRVEVNSPSVEREEVAQPHQTQRGNARHQEQKHPASSRCSRTEAPQHPREVSVSTQHRGNHSEALSWSGGFKQQKLLPNLIKTPRVSTVVESGSPAWSGPSGAGSDHVSHTQTAHVTWKREADDSRSEMGCVKMLKKTPTIVSNITESASIEADPVMVFTIEDEDSDTGGDVNNAVSEHIGHVVQAVEAAENDLDTTSRHGGLREAGHSFEMDNNAFSYYIDTPASYKVDVPHNNFRTFRTSVNMFQLTDEQLIVQCSLKIRKLLLLPGMIASSATICQKRLFPPVPKELRIEHPRTTHPVWGALAFLKRLVYMGLGELVHPLYRRQAIHFRKIRLEYMSEAARVIMQRIGVDEEEYEKSYPKFDDSHITTFVRIEDVDRAVSERLREDGQTVR